MEQMGPILAQPAGTTGVIRVLGAIMTGGGSFFRKCQDRDFACCY
jgi:hypothetical protein